MIFSYVCKLGPFWGFQIFEFQYLLGFSENIISSQNWTILGVIFTHFRAFY